jgi:hypothetical protein
MVLCGSFLGLLLTREFTTHGLRAPDMSEICGTVQMSKKVARSKVELPPPHAHPFKEGSGADLGSSGEGGRSTRGTYPYQGYAGSGPTDRTRGWSSGEGSGGKHFGILHEG